MIKLVELVATQAFDVLQPSDGRPAIGMNFKGRSCDVYIQQILRIVLGTL